MRCQRHLTDKKAQKVQNDLRQGDDPETKKNGDTDMEKIVSILGVAVMLVAAYFLSAVVHELGHVVCGLLHKWKLGLLVVGPFKLYREKLGSKVRLGIEKNPVSWFGLGATIPREESDDNIDIFAKILLAGPIASLVFGILMGVIFLMNRHIFFLACSLLPLTMGITCLLPGLKSGSILNDGTRYRRIRSKGPEAAEEKELFEKSIEQIFAENI